MAEPDSMRLSRQEVAEITGATQQRKQLAWFLENGIPAVEDAKGRLVVLRAAVEAKLMPHGRTRSQKRTEPDLGALRRKRAA